MEGVLVAPPLPVRDRLTIRPFHAFEEGGRKLLFVVENAAFVEADEASFMLAELLTGRDVTSRSALLSELTQRCSAADAEAAVLGLEQLEILVPKEIPRSPPAPDLHLTPLASLVLHVAHDCNLRCGYCYADFGRYGQSFGLMREDLAIAHVAKFFDQLGSTEKIHLTFFGGEPLMNVPVVSAAHSYAKSRAATEGRKISFGLTTNGTLLTKELADWFAREEITITVSIDGPPDVNDRLRVMSDGQGSYSEIVSRVRESGVRAIARVTLTHQSTDVARIVRHLVEAGFVEVGVSPVATGRKRFDLDGEDLKLVLKGFRELAEDFVSWAEKGRLFPFSNVKKLMEQIAAGQPRPTPCGAGTALVAADDKGDWYACHRLVGQEAFRIGNASLGTDGPRRFGLVQRLDPRGREPCGTCWARYLCGGGCHHIAWLHAGEGEAPWAIGEFFCDFLRDWYKLGLSTYADLVERAPGLLVHLRGSRTACSQPSGL
ncbi:MAG: radical SAM protein [Deltaproteobacteria bacterium]|nr:radical SAM protein [Deltaproteobacteria bacterium]